MRTYHIFVSVIVLLFCVCCLSVNSAQAQVDTDEKFSSAVYMSLKVAANPDLLAPAIRDQNDSFVLSKGGPGLNVGPNVRVSDPFDPTPGADRRGRSETTIASDWLGRGLLWDFPASLSLAMAAKPGLTAARLSSSEVQA